MTISACTQIHCHSEFSAAGEESAFSFVAAAFRGPASRRFLSGRRALLPLFFALAVLLLVPRPALATISYDVSLEHAAQHTFHVQMRIPQPAAGTIVAMPAWNALYQVRDFSYRVRDVHAIGRTPENVRYAATKLDKQTWRIESPPADGVQGTQDLLVDYSIQWNDPGPFDSQLNDHHAFINLAEILMYVPDRRSEDTQVTF